MLRRSARGIGWSLCMCVRTWYVLLAMPGAPELVLDGQAMLEVAVSQDCESQPGAHGKYI